MARSRDFHESYYEHNCVVTDFEDVLMSDISGNGFWSKLKRWWFDWFLVSFSNQQAKQYFSSSHAMRSERFRQYRNYRNRIHPLSKFRNYQDIFMYVLFLVNNITFIHNTSITFGQLYFGFYYMGAMIDVIKFADVIINCQTGYIDEITKRVVLERNLGLAHYGSTKLFMHVASALPLHSILLLRYGINVDCTLCKINRFITTLKILNTFGLYRIYEHSDFMTWEKDNYLVTHFMKSLRIYLIGMMAMLSYTDLGDDVSAIYMVETGTVVDGSFVSEMIKAKFVNSDPPSNYRFFILNFGRITKSILLFNLSFQRIKFHLDIIASLCSYIIANMIHLWQLVECYDFLTRLCFIDDRVMKMKQALGNLVSCRQLPDDVTKKLRSYYDYNQSKMRVIEQCNNFLASLPEVLKTEALLSRHTRLLKRIPCFSEWPLDIVQELVLLLKEEIYLANELVAEPWVQNEGLLIVGEGELAVYDGKQEIGHLIDGDYFGELSLVTENEQRTSSVMAITPCVMLLLEKSAFRGYMRKHPDLFATMKEELFDEMSNKNIEHTRTSNLGVKTETV